MPKLSKPILVSIIALVVTVIWCLLPQPATAPAHHSSITKETEATSDGFTKEDLDAHFPRYTGGSRDPFIPGVVTETVNADSSSVAEGKSGWALTGINSIDGDETACVENNASNESVFLKQGQTWNGLKVVSIADSGVIFENQLGQQTTLGFKIPAPDKDTSAVAAGGDQNAPALAGIEPLPPLPYYGNNQRPYAVLRRRYRGRDYSQGQDDQ